MITDKAINDCKEIAKQNLEARKRKLIQQAMNGNPDYYTVDFAYQTHRDSFDFEDLGAGLAVFDQAIRSGASFALFKAVYLAKDGSGEITINLGIHDQEALSVIS